MNEPIDNTVVPSCIHCGSRTDLLEPYFDYDDDGRPLTKTAIVVCGSCDPQTAARRRRRRVAAERSRRRGT
jgi:hypothetical protein